KSKTREAPVPLIRSRQAMPTYDRAKFGAASGVAKGAYVLADAPGGKPDVLLLGTGSEASACVGARGGAGGQAGRVAARHRQRGLALRRGLGGPGQGRRQGPRGQHAVVGAVRSPETGISR